MNDQNSKSGRTLILPMTLAQHGNARFDFDETFFCGWEMKPPEKKEIGERLPMSTV